MNQTCIIQSPVLVEPNRIKIDPPNSSHDLPPVLALPNTQGHMGIVRDVWYDAGSGLLLSVGYDKALRLWAP